MYQNMHQPEFWVFGAEKYRKDPPRNSERICFKNVRKREKNGEKQRKTDYNYYTNREWGKIENYDICVNSDSIGIDNVVDLICSIVEKSKEFAVK